MIGDDFETRIAPSIAYLSPQQASRLFGAIAAGYPIPPTPSRGWEMNFGQLYASASPVHALTLEYGSLGFTRGENSEITSYDDDGYLTGQRVRLHDPAHLYFDEMDITYAYEGDIFTPSFFDRGDHLEKSNYHQFLLSKHFGDRVKASVDYTFDKGTHTAREAALVHLPESKVLDSFRAEFYQRPYGHSVGPYPFAGGEGFALTGSKLILKRASLDGGFETVDLDYGANMDLVVPALFGFTMNGDSYSTGKHVFAHSSVKLSPVLSLNGFYIHQTATPVPPYYSFAKEGFNGGLNINLKSLIERPGGVL